MPTRQSFPLNPPAPMRRRGAFSWSRERPSVPVALVRSFLMRAEGEPTAPAAVAEAAPPGTLSDRHEGDQ
jgi:hypothetical protein